MTDRYTWEDKYSVGDDEIDNQHKQLFAIANSVENHHEKSEIAKSIMELYKYTRIHFQAEEQMMRDVGFPEYREHQLLHDNLITKLNEISNQEFDKAEDGRKFIDFVFNWLTDHILHQDMAYCRFRANSD